VAPLPLGKNPFAVKINNENNNKISTVSSSLVLSPETLTASAGGAGILNQQNEE
jgi:hypothetical protein